MRAGLGYDAHRLVAGRPLVLGGVSIPHAFGLEGFSDADVVAHALIDAILGAAALGDCGTHFPAGNPEFAGARSTDLLTRAVAMLDGHGFAVVNADCTIVAERPALAEHIEAMRAALASAARIDVSRISVKAKRPEGLGFAGDGSGIEAFAIATIEAKP